METRTDEISFHSGQLTEKIDEIIDLCLPDKIRRTTRMWMYASYVVVEYSADSAYRWSTGEVLLWDLLTSLAGRGRVNLADLANYFRGTDEWPLILSTIGAL